MRACSFLTVFLLSACQDEVPGTIYIEPSTIVDEVTFFRSPFPSDSRLDGDGHGDFTNYPTYGVEMMGPALSIARDSKGYSPQSAVYFQSREPLADIDENFVSLDSSSPYWIIDIDKDSASLGTIYPTVGRVLHEGRLVKGGDLLAVAPMPGVILTANTQYAYVVGESLKKMDGSNVDPTSLAEVKGYERLKEVLQARGLAPNIAAISIVTTGDPVLEVAELSERVLSSIELDSLEFEVSTESSSTMCVLSGVASVPQFQTGTPPFNEQGTFDVVDGIPLVQRHEDVPFVLSLPVSQQPAGGFPLMIYLHGSGGTSKSMLGVIKPGNGPAAVAARNGIATFGTSLPLSPERYGPATDYEYLNFNNLASFRDTFRQGVIEQRLLIKAILAQRFSVESLEGCLQKPTLSPDDDSFYFRQDTIVAAGQSMGGMYTNLLGAVEPLIGAVVPMAAGGHWTRMITMTELIENAEQLLFNGLLRVSKDNRSYLHPSLQLLTSAWQTAEPINFMPRIAETPLPNHPARHIFQPIGAGDVYFAEPIYDAASLAYSNQQAGPQIWQGTQAALSLVNKGGLAELPASLNRSNSRGESITGIVSQYTGGGYNGHFVALVREDLRLQWGCFFKSFFATGRPVVVPANSADCTAE